MSIIVFEGNHGAGKSSTIYQLQNKFDIISLKSIPEWFRKYISFARSMEPNTHKKYI